MKYLITIKLQLFLLLFLIFHGNSFSQLNGTYTIGAGGDYTTIASSVNALNVTGVNGPVVFNIKSGTYRERVTIDSIHGASSVNTITFQSETGNRNDVLWNDSVNFTTLVTLNKTDYVTFKNISFRNSYSLATQYAFYFQGNCNSINIISNNIVCISRESNGIYCNDATMTNLRIEDNMINARTAINLSGPTISSHTQIIKNKIQRYEGILISKHDSLYIEANEINISYLDNYEPTPVIHYYNAKGIVLKACNKYIKIVKNKIIANGQPRYNYSFGLRIDSSLCQNSLIANNFIYYIDGTGIAMLNSNNLKIYNNTVHTTAAYSPYSGATNLLLENCSGCKVKNNIFGGKFNGIDNRFNSFLSSDFNSYYPFDQPPFGFYHNNNTYYSIESYRIASNTDFNSRMNTVSFVSNTDLHLAGSSIGNNNLKGTPIPEITDDIDGNPRHPFFPYMGADEVLTEKFIDLSFTLEAMYPNLDSVKVYLASSVSPFQFIDSSTAFSQIDSSRFSALLLFKNAVLGNYYYIAVKHRNSVETWSANPVRFISDTISYDFTSSSDMAFGNNMIQVGTSPVRFAFYSGDVNQDGEINLTDIIAIDNDVSNFATGYLNTDLTGNAMVDLTDLIFSHNNSVNFIRVIKP